VVIRKLARSAAPLAEPVRMVGGRLRGQLVVDGGGL